MCFDQVFIWEECEKCKKSILNVLYLCSFGSNFASIAHKRFSDILVLLPCNELEEPITVNGAKAHTMQGCIGSGSMTACINLTDLKNKSVSRVRKHERLPLGHLCG